MTVSTSTSSSLGWSLVRRTQRAWICSQVQSRLVYHIDIHTCTLIYTLYIFSALLTGSVATVTRLLARMYLKFPLQALEPILMQKKKNGLVLVTDQKSGRSDGKMQHLVSI